MEARLIALAVASFLLLIGAELAVAYERKLRVYRAGDAVADWWRRRTVKRQRTVAKREPARVP